MTNILAVQSAIDAILSEDQVARLMGMEGLFSSLETDSRAVSLMLRGVLSKASQGTSLNCKDIAAALGVADQLLGQFNTLAEMLLHTAVRLSPPEQPPGTQAKAASIH